jgi:hypothetical protein
MGATSLARTFYFAEGSCRPGFDPYFSILNPGGTDAQVTITYMKGDGTTDTQAVTVAKGSRATVAVKDKLGVGDDDAHDFSAKVACWNEQDILVERPIYFDYQGLTGGSDVVGVTTPSPTYYFAEGTCRPGFDPYIAVANPQVYDAKVKVTYLLGDGSTKAQNILVPAGSRRTVHPPDVLGTADDVAHDFSARVESVNNAHIVAERPTYFNYKGAWTGGSDVVGADVPARTFQFAEGTCRPGFDPYISILNLAGAGDASVKVTYSLGDGSTKTQDIAVPAHSRRTVHPPDILGTGDDPAHDFSVKVECTNGLPIVAERPMYFDFMGWTGGSCMMGH